MKLMLLTYSCAVFSNLLLLLFPAQIVPLKLSKPKTVLLAALYSLFVIPKFYFGIFSYPVYLINIGALAILVAMPFLVYEGKLWKRLLVFFWFWILQFSSDACMTGFVTADGDTTYVQLWTWNEWLRYWFISLFLYLSFCSVSLLALRMMTMRKFRFFYLLFLLYPLSLFFFIYSRVFPLNNGFWFTGLGLGVVAELFLLFYTINQEKKAELEEELKSVRHRMELEQTHYQMVEERREELAKIRHDFNNYLAAIGRLVRMGENEDAWRLIGQLTEDIGRTKENPYCGISVVNAVLEEKEADCTRQGIRLETELDMPSSFGIEPLHLCSIFGNLLDNAIEGCVRSGAEEPVIRLASRLDGDYLFIKTENPSPPPEEKALPGRGRGTKILTEIAREYGGDYAGSYEEGRYVAVVSLLILKCLS